MQAGEEEDALKMLEKLQAEAVPESIDWKRVNAMTRQLRASSSGYHSAMAAADEAGRAGDAKRERSALARAAGFLSGRRDLLERTRQNKNNPLPALNLVLKKMQNGIGGAPVKYAIRARSLELHVDLAGNDQLADLTPLSQFPITHLDISDTRVADLMPLSMVPFQVLRADRTPVTTLSPVAKGPLRLLTAEGGAVTDDGSLYNVRGNLPGSGPMTWLTGTTGTPPGPSGTFRSLLGIHDLGNGIREWSQDTISPTSSPIRDLPGEWALWDSGKGLTFPPSAAGPASTMGQADLGFRIALELPPIPW